MELLEELSRIRLPHGGRTRYLPEMIKGITDRLRGTREIEAVNNLAHVGCHGQVGHGQCYSAHLIVQESRILQVCIFETIERNLATVDFTAVLPDIMIIGDSQLKETISSFLTMQLGGGASAVAFE